MIKISLRISMFLIGFTWIGYELKASKNTTQSVARTTRGQQRVNRRMLPNRPKRRPSHNLPTRNIQLPSTSARQQQQIARRQSPAPTRIQQPSVTPQIQPPLKTINPEPYQKPEIKNTAIPIEPTQDTANPYQTTQELLSAAEALLARPRAERTWKGDLYSGYTKQQELNARILLSELDPMLDQVYKAMKLKEKESRSLKEVFFIKPGKEKEYAALSLEITKLKDMLARLRKVFDDQIIIAGIEFSKTYGAFLSTPLGWAAVAGKVGYDYLTNNPAKNKTDNETSTQQAKKESQK